MKIEMKKESLNVEDVENKGPYYNIILMENKKVERDKPFECIIIKKQCNKLYKNGMSVSCDNRKIIKASLDLNDRLGW